MDRPIKVVLFKCDKCHKENTLVAYHHNFGWYCKDCLSVVRNRLNDVIDKINICATQINQQFGINLSEPEDEEK